ncbi:hypothetical protein U8326_03845 [Tsuneonella sp. CC-YZS046]|uniref:hypothetical protein n=1 Tax=Tsuneonella sp. CC-YZS046 TaxID=3042152 RepID=UPI002D7A1BFD|nr:hypothetical protein [Tsuneonella sp. CC-YZS046]WRO67311.1 hypothetical protein U8326_03845 [Tsuneonella sp. CC-YZS046]
MKKFWHVGLSTVALATSVPAVAKDQSALTGLALQQIQAKDFETNVDILFPSIVTVFQDAGYRITEADKSSGFVSGIGSAEQKMTFNLWFGLGKKKTVPIVSAFVEQRGPSIARVRLNFVLSKAKSRNVYTDETPVTDPAIYKDAFERIEKEVFIRQAMNAPATSPSPVASDQVPDASPDGAQNTSVN